MYLCDAITWSISEYDRDDSCLTWCISCQWCEPWFSHLVCYTWQPHTLGCMKGVMAENRAHKQHTYGVGFHNGTKDLNRTCYTLWLTFILIHTTHADSRLSYCTSKAGMHRMLLRSHSAEQVLLVLANSKPLPILCPI